MTPELGLTQHLLGAVVLILKQTLLSEGLISLIVDETAEVKGPAMTKGNGHPCDKKEGFSRSFTVEGQLVGRVDGEDLLGLGHGEGRYFHFTSGGNSGRVSRSEVTLGSSCSGTGSPCSLK